MARETEYKGHLECTMLARIPGRPSRGFRTLLQQFHSVYQQLARPDRCYKPNILAMTFFASSNLSGGNGAGDDAAQPSQGQTSSPRKAWPAKAVSERRFHSRRRELRCSVEQPGIRFARSPGWRTGPGRAGLSPPSPNPPAGYHRSWGSFS